MATWRVATCLPIFLVFSSSLAFSPLNLPPFTSSFHGSSPDLLRTCRFGCTSNSRKLFLQLRDPVTRLQCSKEDDTRSWEEEMRVLFSSSPLFGSQTEGGGLMDSTEGDDSLGDSLGSDGEESLADIFANSPLFSPSSIHEPKSVQEELMDVFLSSPLMKEPDPGWGTFESHSEMTKLFMSSPLANASLRQSFEESPLPCQPTTPASVKEASPLSLEHNTGSEISAPDNRLEREMSEIFSGNPLTNGRRYEDDIAEFLEVHASESLLQSTEKTYDPLVGSLGAPQHETPDDIDILFGLEEEFSSDDIATVFKANPLTNGRRYEIDTALAAQNVQPLGRTNDSNSDAVFEPDDRSNEEQGSWEDEISQIFGSNALTNGKRCEAGEEIEVEDVEE